MDKKTGIIAAAVGTGITAIVGGGAFYFSPYLALNNMKTATVHRDADALAVEIDFPSLRTSIKAGVRAQVLKQIARAGAGATPAMGKETIGKMVDPAVDKIVTPEGLDQLMQDKIPGAKIDIEDLQKNIAESDIKMGYESLDRFVVHINDKVDRTKAVSLILKRSGLAWKLSGVDISQV
jgi:Protein of unknown function (DUF2939)